MKAVKGNKEYTIDESQKKSYQDAGYDIYSSDGKQIAYGRGKTVPYGDYVDLKKQLEMSEAERKRLKEAVEAMSPEKKTGKKAGE